eukprot:TRINITY_DN35181_c0_g1_i1.p7 TRINITY_DN35181_c0_g1~~TRINITY_DN35181_c0_g1_i1.p7  ORF type:complete len:117 (-),score=10.01 TRINITY_DN35181_c0_g1_i1:405-755(-)
MLLDILSKYSAIKVEQRIVKMDELFAADEVWLTSSSKEIAPVIEIDGKPVGNGEIGDVWLAAQTLYTAHKNGLLIVNAGVKLLQRVTQEKIQKLLHLAKSDLIIVGETNGYFNYLK